PLRQESQYNVNNAFQRSEALPEAPA
ncbi:MAG: hypothetical protein ACD_60C00030G0023, partial [uncultured bacterium]